MEEKALDEKQIETTKQVIIETEEIIEKLKQDIEHAKAKLVEQRKILQQQLGSGEARRITTPGRVISRFL